MAENSGEVKSSDPPQMGTTVARFMKLTGRILEMIRPEHAKNGTHQTLGGQVITVPGSVNGTIRTRKLAAVLGSNSSML